MLNEEISGPYSNTLVWDSHAGFEFSTSLDLTNIWRWKECGVDFLSLNAGYDVKPWTYSITALSYYRKFIEENADRYILAKKSSDVKRAKLEGKLAIAFDMEGMCCLNNDLSMIKFYYDLGVRQMNFAYNLNNSAGGGCHDKDIGLTKLGRDIVAEMNRVGMVIDCSHNSYKTTMEAMEISKDPVIFSHSNPRSIRDHERNITDEQIKTCAKTGGVIGINGVYWFLDKEKHDIEMFVRHLDYVVQIVGPKHVGIGLDFVFENDALFETHNTNSDFWPDSQYAGRKMGFLPPESLPKIYEKLIKHGYLDEDILSIFGKNFLRVAETVWK